MSSLVDQERYAAIKTRLRGEGQSVVNPLASLSPADLRRLRSEIDRLLPDDSVKGMDLGDELVQQYHKTKQLMDDTLDSDDCPANQKAQVCNSVVTILAQLTKLQEDLEMQKTMALMEAVLVDVIKTLPEATKAEFFSEYERLAAREGLA